MTRLLAVVRRVLNGQFEAGVWTLRASWALLILLPMAFCVCAVSFLDSVADAIADGNRTVAWDDEPSWFVWLWMVILATGSFALPRLLDRRALARLRARIPYIVDPAQSGSYRTPPRLIPHLPDALRRAALARYTGRIALAFALAGLVVLPSVIGIQPFVAGHCCRYFWRSIYYLPMAALCLLLVAAQLPTRRAALRSLSPAR